MVTAPAVFTLTVHPTTHAIMRPQDMRQHDKAIFLIVVETLIKRRACVGDLFQRGTSLCHVVGALRQSIKRRALLLLITRRLTRLHALDPQLSHVAQSLLEWSFGHFDVVKLDNGVSLDFADADGAIRPQHYAFLISEAEFDAVLGRIKDRGLGYWADPRGSRPGEINHTDGGRGVYFRDPDGHYLEVITRPYGSGG